MPPQTMRRHSIFCCLHQADVGPATPEWLAVTRNEIGLGRGPDGSGERTS
jgi:hypothetical protein